MNSKIILFLGAALALGSLAAGCSTAPNAASTGALSATASDAAVPSPNASGASVPADKLGEASAPAAPNTAAQANPPSQPESNAKAPSTTNAAASASAKTAAAAAAYPHIPVDHIVVVVEENHSYDQIIGSKNAPYMNELIQKGALLNHSYAVTHPSQPNYLALFSGSTQGVTDDSCGKTFDTPNLAQALKQKQLSFVGYSEDMPKAGFTGCSSKGYARKHNPWVQFTNVPQEANQPFTAFPQDFSKLPKVSFVVPNHQNDMHDGTVYQADTWLKDHMDAYVKWAEANRSLLVVTWDEDDNAKANHIPTIVVGPMVKPGSYNDKVTHYSLLRTIEELNGLPLLGESAKAPAIQSIWK